MGWIANALNILGLVLLGRRHRIGWLFGIAAECLWIWRAGRMGMPDLVFISTVYCLIASWNYLKWAEEGSGNGPESL